MLLTDDRDVLSRKAIALPSIEIMADGSPADFDAVLHPDFFSHEQVDEPPETRGYGSAKAHRVALWLRAAWEGLDWVVHDVVEQGDLAVVRCTMSRRHTGDFAAYDIEGNVADVFAPTGATFATMQSHWLRMRDGRPVEHWGEPRRPRHRRAAGMDPADAGLPRPLRAREAPCAAGRRSRASRDGAAVRPLAGRAGGPHGARAAVEAMRRVPEEVFAGFHPTRLLHESFADLGWVVHHVVAEGDLVAVSMTVSGRQTGPSRVTARTTRSPPFPLARAAVGWPRAPRRRRRCTPGWSCAASSSSWPR